MKLPQNSISRAAALLTLTALLAACNTQTSTTAGTPTSTTGLVSLTLKTSSLVSALKTQGIPFKEDGTPAVTSVHVRVYDQGRNLVKFTADNIESADGTRDFIKLDSEASTLTVQVHPGTYTFHGSGLSAPTGGIQLAYGAVGEVVVNSAVPTVVTLALKTLIGKVSLESVLPMNYVLPGQIFDVKLKVETYEAGSTRYPVPLADFELANPESPNGPSGLTVLASSKLGSRVQVTGTGSTVGLTQEIRGCFGADEPNGLVCDRTFGKISFPLFATAAVGTDLERPALSLNQPHYDLPSGPGAFIDGHVDDNVGIARLQVYDSVLLIASTEAAEYGKNGVQQIELFSKTSGGPNTEWRVPVPFDINGETHQLVALAQDTSGNETRVTETVNATTLPHQRVE